jgi:hypothetical protein
LLLSVTLLPTRGGAQPATGSETVLLTGEDLGPGFTRVEAQTVRASSPEAGMAGDFFARSDDQGDLGPEAVLVGAILLAASPDAGSLARFLDAFTLGIAVSVALEPGEGPLLAEESHWRRGERTDADGVARGWEAVGFRQGSYLGIVAVGGPVEMVTPAHAEAWARVMAERMAVASVPVPVPVVPLPVNPEPPPPPPPAAPPLTATSESLSPSEPRSSSEPPSTSEPTRVPTSTSEPTSTRVPTRTGVPTSTRGSASPSPITTAGPALSPALPSGAPPSVAPAPPVAPPPPGL